MPALVSGARGIYTAAGGALQNILTAANVTRIKSLFVYNIHTAPLTFRMYIDTYNYGPEIILAPLEGREFSIGAVLGASSNFAISCVGGQNLLYYHVSYAHTVNPGGVLPVYTGNRGYYTAGANVRQVIWTPTAGGTKFHRVLEIAFWNAHTAPVNIKIDHNTYYATTLQLAPSEGTIIDSEAILNSNETLGITADVATTLLMWHFSGIDNLNGAA